MSQDPATPAAPDERVEISKRLVLINSASAMVTRLLGLSVFFWVQQYLIRHVHQEELKAYYIVQAAQIYIPLVAMIVVSGLGRYVTESYAVGDDRKVTQIVSSMLPLTCATSLLMAGLAALVVWKIQLLLNVDPEEVGDARLMFSILLGILCLRVATMPLAVGVFVRQKFLWGNVIGLISEVIRISVLFALLFGVSTRVIWLVVAMIPSALFDITAGVVYSMRLVPAIRFRLSEFRKELIGPIVSFGGWTFAGRLIAIMRETVGALSLSHRGTAVDVVSYRNGALVETKLFPMLLAPLPTALPALTAMHATNQLERLRRYYFKLGRYLGWAFFGAAVPLLVFRREFWLLYLGPEKAHEYAAVGTVMLLLLLKSFVTFPQPIMAQVALAKARQREAQVRVMVIEGLAVLATLYFVIVAKQGAIGAAIGTMSITLIGAPLLHWTFGLRLVNARFADWARSTVLPAFIPAVACAPVWYLARRTMPLDSWLHLGLAFAVGAACYAVCVWVLLGEDERGEVLTIVSRVRRRLRVVSG